MCCASYRGYVCTGPNTARITYVGLNNMPGLRGALQDLTPMNALVHLTVSQCAGVSGQANFREMRQLTELNLYGTRGAYINVATLRTLSDLSLLWLSGSNAYGDATAVRDNVLALSSWGSGHQDYTACAIYSTCPAGTRLIQPAATSVGMDECACCDSTTDTPRFPWRRRHPTTGACYDPSAFPACVGSSRPLCCCVCTHTPFLCVWLHEHCVALCVRSDPPAVSTTPQPEVATGTRATNWVSSSPDTTPQPAIVLVSTKASCATCTIGNLPLFVLAATATLTATGGCARFRNV